MKADVLHGSCLCGAVRYEVRKPYLRICASRTAIAAAVARRQARRTPQTSMWGQASSRGYPARKSRNGLISLLHRASPLLAAPPAVALYRISPEVAERW
jgi:hypothetical protein